MSDKKLFCAFCTRSSDEVKYLMAGPGVAICDECISELMSVIAEKNADWRDAQIERLSKMRN
ncbi:MAG TPA: ClpX C4-type zinc finger protein [Xanthobacteraceae bacterium]